MYILETTYRDNYPSIPGTDMSQYSPVIAKVLYKQRCKYYFIYMIGPALTIDSDFMKRPRNRPPGDSSDAIKVMFLLLADRSSQE